jgi:glycine cleavage system H protein
MVVILVLLTVLAFLAVDYVISRRQRALAVSETASAPVVEPVAEHPVWVAGYNLPEKLHYHRGHTWVRVLDDDTVVVGIDDFARRLVGGVKRVLLPSPGSSAVQGAIAFAVDLGGRVARFLSPVSGEVVEVNTRLEEQGSRMLEDPYGRGWVMKIRARDLAANLRNLLSGRLARRWMEDTREAMQLQLMALTGSVIQDGGELAPDFAQQLSEEEWRALTREFLLT